MQRRKTLVSTARIRTACCITRADALLSACHVKPRGPVRASHEPLMLHLITHSIMMHFRASTQTRVHCDGGVKTAHRP